MNKNLFWYRDHLRGGIYYTEQEQDYDSLWCEQCGDMDDFVGCMTMVEAKEMGIYNGEV